jgi:hypothetical protein
MGRLRLFVVLAIVTGGFAVSAVAGVGPQQRTDPITAVLAANRVGVPYERTCAGEDGQYRQAVETYVGSVTGDPRLTGMATMVLTTFTNVSTGNGTGTGIVVVRETGGALRFRAVLQGVVTTGNAVTNLKGLLTGKVLDRGTQAGGRLVANFLAIGVGSSVYVGIGGNATSANPAVIQSGHCPLGPRTAK